jgi:hypothetical protein
LIAGKMPGGPGAANYYVAVDLQPGELTTQLQVSGAPDTEKMLELDVLDSNSQVADYSTVRANMDPKNEATYTNGHFD